MGKGDANEEARAARQAEDERQGRIRRGTNRVNYLFDRQFDGTGFYAEQGQNYRDYAMPQLDEQYRDAGSELGFDLARRGLTDSSVRADRTADLSELYELNRQDVVDQSRQVANDARSGVEDARNDLILTLQSTADAEGATRSALARADALSQPEAYSPLEDMFLQFTSGLSSQAALERAYAAGSGVRPRFNMGIYGPSSSSVQVS